MLLYWDRIQGHLLEFMFWPYHWKLTPQRYYLVGVGRISSRIHLHSNNTFAIAHEKHSGDGRKHHQHQRGQHALSLMAECRKRIKNRNLFQEREVSYFSNTSVWNLKFVISPSVILHELLLLFHCLKYNSFNRSFILYSAHSYSNLCSY